MLKRLAGYGRADWFNLGDRDLATHIHRTVMLAEERRCPRPRIRFELPCA